MLQPTQEGELRRRVLFYLPAPVPLLVLVGLIVGWTPDAAGWTILLSASVAVGTLLLAVVVQPTPLPEGLPPETSARRSLHRFRQITSLRVALAVVPILIGAAASVIGGGMYPLLAALALAWPQMVLAMPTFLTITRARRAMEAWGTRAYLWHALSLPAPVTWPVLTAARAQYLRWRDEREQARAAGTAEAEPGAAAAAGSEGAEGGEGPEEDPEGGESAADGSRTAAGAQRTGDRAADRSAAGPRPRPVLPSRTRALLRGGALRRTARSAHHRLSAARRRPRTKQ